MHGTRDEAGEPPYELGAMLVCLTRVAWNSGVSGDLDGHTCEVAWVANWMLSDDGAVVCCRGRSRGGRPTTAIADITGEARRV
jgi:hypothetical protein